MDQFNFTDFLRDGTVLNFNDLTPESVIIDSFGAPTEIEDYGSKGKYLHYGNIRFSTFKNFLNGITVFFYEYKINVENEVFDINENTSLIIFLKFLNKISVKWNIPYENSKLDYLLVVTSTGIDIYYYYENAKLIKMNRHW